MAKTTKQSVTVAVHREIEQARRRKAEQLALVLLRAGAEHYDLTAMREQDWRLASQAAGFAPHYLPSVHTQLLTMQMLVDLSTRRIEARAHAQALAARLQLELSGGRTA